MKIDGIHSNNSFGAFYRLPNTVENIKVLEENVIPVYSALRQEPVFAFIGETPITLPVKEKFVEFANLNGGSLEWLRMNAKNFGVNIPHFDTSYINIITSLKDVKGFMNALSKNVKLNFGIFTKLRQLKQIYSDVRDLPKDTPRHVRIAQCLTKTYNRENLHFNEFLSDKPIIDVLNAKDLMIRMMTEK